MTASAIFRGKIPTGQAERELRSVVDKNSSYFYDWIHSNIEFSMCDVPPNGKQLEGVLLANTAAIQEVYKVIAEKFSSMLRRKAFLHWYTSEGMDEMEFTESESNLNDLISEYQEYSSATCEEDGEF